MKWTLTARTHVQLKNLPTSDIPNLKLEQPELIFHVHTD